MSSFYGGKQGRTYHIVQRYNSVADMVAAFSGGGAYSEVNYGQYVIIDTILVNHNKTSPQNGLLYRRGFDYNDNPDFYPQPHKNDTDENEQYIYYDGQGNLKEEQWNIAWSNWIEHPGAGAIYVGQIVGPQGQTPEIILASWEQLNQIQDREIKTVIPVSKTSGDNQNPVYDSNHQPRNYEDGTPIWYGDLIKVGSCTVKDEYGNVSGAQLAFDIPHLVLKPQVVNTNPYLASTVTENPASTAHPFYYKWDFEIPGGKHGQDLTQIVKEIGIDTKYIKTKDNQLQDLKEYFIRTENENGVQYTHVETPSIEDIDLYYEFYGQNQTVDEDEYLTYTITNYDSGEPGDTDAAAAMSTAHLGRWPYRVINEINPILKVREILNLEKWGQKYEDNQRVVDIGTLYREDDYPDDIYWVCVQSGTIINPNDTPKKANATMSNLGFQDESLGGGMVWRVVNIPQTTPAHSLDIDYKAGPNDIISGLRNIDYTAVDKDGKMYVFYSDSDIPYYLTTVRSIEYIKYDSDNGVVKIKYYGQEERSLYNPKVIKQVTYQTGLLNPQQFQVHFDDGTFNTVSERTNVIAATRRLGDNLLFLYSDPDMRQNIPQDRKVTFNQVWTDYLTGSTYAPNSLVWYDFGPLGAQYHVQGVYTYDDLKQNGFLEYGFRDFTNQSDPHYNSNFDTLYGDLSSREGWLVTVLQEHIQKELTLDTEIDPNKTYYTKDENTQEYQEVIEPDVNDIGSYYQDKKINVPRIFAFDYTKLQQQPSHVIPDGQGGTILSRWYEVMSLTASALDPNFFVSVSDDQTNSHNNRNFTDPSKLSTNGLWFVVSYGHD